MYVIREMRLNKFTPQAVPSCRSLFQRFAKSFSDTSPEVSTGSKQTIDCIGDSDLNNLDKLQSLHLADMMIQKSEQFRNNPKGTESLDLNREDL